MRPSFSYRFPTKLSLPIPLKAPNRGFHRRFELCQKTLRNGFKRPFFERTFFKRKKIHVLNFNEQDMKAFIILLNRMHDGKRDFYNN